MIHCYDAFGQALWVGCRVGCFRGKRDTGRFIGRVQKLSSIIDRDGKQVALRVVVEKDIPDKAAKVVVIADNTVLLPEKS